MPMALEGIKVIDVSQVAAVPMCARHLADFGADVIHVENTETGDSWRSLQAVPGGGGVAGIPSDIPYNWETFNRNKKSLAINLATKGGQEIVHRLAKDADIFVTNLRLPERDKFNMGYEDLNAINPRLIYGSVTGHGMKGPYNDMPAYDTTVYFARSGVNHMLMGTGGSLPVPRAAFGDTVAGMALAFGVMTALYSRDREGGLGEGQEVDTSLLFTGIYQLSLDMASALATGQDDLAYRGALFAEENTEEDIEEMTRLGAEARAAVKKVVDFMRERLPNAMANTYATADERSLRFNCLNADRYWAKFCKLIDRQDLENDDRFSTIEAREENRKELYHITKEVFASRTLDEWRPLTRDFPASPNQSLVDVIDDPQAIANDFFPNYDHPNYGPMRIIASPVNLSKTPATIRSPAPEFSQHTEEILMDEGYEWEEIEEFQEQGIIPI